MNTRANALMVLGVQAEHLAVREAERSGAPVAECSYCGRPHVPEPESTPAWSLCWCCRAAGITPEDARQELPF